MDTAAFSVRRSRRHALRKQPLPGLLLLGLFDVVFLAEALDAAGGVDEFLLAGKERVAGGAYFHLDIFDGGTGFYDVSAGAGDFGHLIFGMYLFFHKGQILRH
jgi:hypothetical protein